MSGQHLVFAENSATLVNIMIWFLKYPEKATLKNNFAFHLIIPMNIMSKLKLNAYRKSYVFI